MGGREVLGRGLVGDHLQDHRALGQHLAIVQHQRRYLALRVDLGEIVAGFGLFRLEIDLDEFVSKTGLMERDMRG